MPNNKFNLLTTGDGTQTIYYSEYQQAMHSHSGAYEEALLKHVYPSRLLDNINNGANQISVLDVGFGLGYNTLALLHALAPLPQHPQITIVSLEKDRSYQDLLDTIRFKDERDDIYTTIKKAFKSGEHSINNVTLKIYFQDGRKTLRQISGYMFDAVFQDPFSPGKNPELWTVEYFLQLKKIIKQQSIVTTYSAAEQVRMALVEAGFHLGPGPSVGGKKEGTLASLTDHWPEFHRKTIQKLMKSIKAVPYHDLNFEDERPVILQRRLDTMADKRKQVK